MVPWGTSGKGLELLGLELYAGPANEAERPLFKYVGNVHGDEPSGRQLLLALAEHLCVAHAGKVPAVLRLLGAVGLFIIPTMNPDGFDAHIRENRWGVRMPTAGFLGALCTVPTHYLCSYGIAALSDYCLLASGLLCSGIIHTWRVPHVPHTLLLPFRAAATTSTSTATSRTRFRARAMICGCPWARSSPKHWP